LAVLRSKCPYCDFNSHVRASIDEAAWRAALLQALDRQAERLAGRRSTPCSSAAARRR